MKSSKLLLTAFFTLFAGFPFNVLAQDAERAPRLINYQGKLTDANNLPFGGEQGGTFKLRFMIYPVPEGGVAAWAEERDVVVIGGIFNVALGGAGGEAVNEIPMDLGVAIDAPERFLETTVVSGPEGAINQTLAPRQQLASVPYALVSQTTERAAIAESLIPELMKILNPPGTIITYGGAVTDPGGRAIVEPVPGYLLCNGAVIDDVLEDGKYANLKTAISTRWGNGQDSNPATVNLPDLRGVFLRGWSGSATDSFTDEDRNDPSKRLARMGGGAVGNSIGSFQQDEFQSHGHPIAGATNQLYPVTVAGAFGQPGTYVPIQKNFGDGATQFVYGNNVVTATGVGASETRSKNAYVAYLIKY